MTRKEYVHKMQALALAIRNHPESLYPEGYKVGNALRSVRDKAKDVPRIFGNYQKAWDSDGVKFCRQHYMNEAF